jgi:hypothetical protein
MKSEIANCESPLARPLAAEDLRCGDFVSVLYEVVDWPSFFWQCDAQLLPPDKPVRLQSRPADSGQPLKVKSICLPFVFVKEPTGKHRILDIRHHHLVRLTPRYAEAVWKTLRDERKSSLLGKI